MSDRLMHVEDVVRYLGLSKRTIYQHLRQGTLPAYRLGRQWRFRKEKLDEWLDRKANHPKWQSHYDMAPRT